MSNVSLFLRELSELGRKTGLGLAGEIKLFHLESDDYLFNYSLGDDVSLRLGFGDSNSDAGAGAGGNTKSRFNAYAPPDICQDGLRVNQQTYKAL